MLFLRFRIVEIRILDHPSNDFAKISAQIKFKLHIPKKEIGKRSRFFNRIISDCSINSSICIFKENLHNVKKSVKKILRKELSNHNL